MWPFRHRPLSTSLPTTRRQLDSSHKASTRLLKDSIRSHKASTYHKDNTRYKDNTRHKASILHHQKASTHLRQPTLPRLLKL